jgi:hypothetical protein
MLAAMGYSNGRVLLMHVLEHLLPAAYGVAVGVGSAVVAVWPSLLGSDAAPEAWWIGAVSAAAIVNGAMWSGVASRVGLRKGAAEALRDE